MIYRYSTSGHYLTIDPDSTFFLRQYEQSMAQGEIVRIDDYSCFPDQVNLKYPPFHMNFLVETSLLLMSLFPNQHWTIDRTIGWMPPVFCWLVGLIFTFFVWRKTRNKPLTLLVSLACIPGFTSTMLAQFLQIDYHFLNHFFIWAWLISGCLYTDEKRQKWMIAGIFAALLFMMTWAGTPLFFFIVTLYTLFLFISKSQNLENFGQFCFVSMLFSSISVGIYLLLTGRASAEVGDLAYIQPITIATGAIFIKLLASLHQRRASLNKFSPSSFWKLIAGVFCAIIISAFFLRNQLIAGINFILVSDMAMRSIFELGPGIDFSRVILSESNLADAIFKFSIVFFLFPLMQRFNPSGLFSGGGKTLRDFSLIFIFMSIFAIRYFRWLGIAIGFWNGVALYFVWTRLKEMFKTEKTYYKMALRTGLTMLFFMLLHFLICYPLFFRSSINPKSTLMDSLHWLNRFTPSTAGYQDRQKPEYSVYSYWHIGNLINYYAKRPTLCSNNMRGYAKMARVFTAETEEQAYSLCAQYRIKYFYINSFYNFSDEMVRFMRAFVARPNVRTDSYDFFPEYVDRPSGEKDFQKTFHYWLRDRLAMAPAGNFSQASSQLRIVYCLEYDNIGKSPAYLIYELVKGALIIGKADPGTSVKFLLRCKFDNVERDYVRETQTDDNGNFSLRLPYATGYKNGQVETASEYKIIRQEAGKKVESGFSLSEDAVKNGIHKKIL
jgi:hypothetical protein